MSELLHIPEAKMIISGAGGDVLRYGDTIIRHGLEMSGAEHSSVLLIPTAEPYADWYDETVQYTHDRFTKELGLGVSILHPFRIPPTEQEMADMFGKATHLWVAGGDTDYMLKFWAEHGITDYVLESLKNGTVFMGGSAAALAPMERGHSDYQSYHVEKDRPWEYEMISGLGWIAAAAAPHFDSIKDGVKRGDNFIPMFQADVVSPDLALGFDNMAGLALMNGKFRVIQSSLPNKFPGIPNIHVLHRSDEGVQVEQLPVSSEYQLFDLVA